MGTRISRSTKATERDNGLDEKADLREGAELSAESEGPHPVRVRVPATGARRRGVRQGPVEVSDSKQIPDVEGRDRGAPKCSQAEVGTCEQRLSINNTLGSESRSGNEEEEREVRERPRPDRKGFGKTKQTIHFRRHGPVIIL